MRKLSNFILPLIACILFTFLAFKFFPFTITDDAYISYRYAENLSSGHGFVFNEGEKVEGYSNFLYVVILAVLSKTGMDINIASKTLGLLCGLGTILALFFLSNIIRPRWRSINGIAGILLASSIPFCVWCVGGLETPIYTFLIVIALNLYFREWQKEKGIPFSALFFLGVALTRPEGPVIFGVIFLTQLIYDLSHRKSLRKFTMWSCTFLIPYLCYFLWRWNYFDSFLPNTAYAKLGGDIRRFYMGIQYIESFLRDQEGIFFYLVGFFIAFSRYGIGYVRMVIVLCIAIMTCFAVYAGGDWMPCYRFIVPILPLAYLLVQEGVFEIVSVFQNHINSKKKIAMIMMIIILLCSLTVNRYTYYGGSLRSIAGQNLKWIQYKNLGLWMNKNLPDDSVVALASAGIMPYYSRLRIIDMYGLLDKTIARKGKSYKDGPIFTKSDAKYVLSRAPDYILLFGWIVDEDGKKVFKGSTPYSNDMLEQPEFHRRYELILKQNRRKPGQDVELMLLFVRNINVQ